MLSRRDFLAATGGALALADASAMATEAVLPTSASTPQPTLPPTEQIMYSAVRLFNVTAADVLNNKPATLHWGPAFSSIFLAPRTVIFSSSSPIGT
jgi:hypothetical protein